MPASPMRQTYEVNKAGAFGSQGPGLQESGSNTQNSVATLN